MVGENVQPNEDEEEVSELVSTYKAKASLAREKLQQVSISSSAAAVSTLLKVLETPKTTPKMGLNNRALAIRSNPDDPNRVLVISDDEADQEALHLVIFGEPYWYSVNGEGIQMRETTHRKVEPMPANEGQIDALQHLLVPFSD